MDGTPIDYRGKYRPCAKVVGLGVAVMNHDDNEGGLPRFCQL